MNIVICSIPDGPLTATMTPLEKGANITLQRPVGILRLIDWMNENGLNSDIYDINNLRHTDEDLIKTFKKIKPDVVGLSATLSHCYPNVIRISKILRNLFPNVWIVLGGHMAASANVILNKTDTDLCVVGDGEIPWVKLVNYFKTHPTNKNINFDELKKIKGLAYLDKDQKLKVTGNAEQLSGSKLRYPNYTRLREALKEKGDMVQELFSPIRNDKVVMRSEFYNEKYINKTIGQIETSKGCVARCTFCQRSTKGYRIYELDNLEKHVLELKEKFNVGGIFITDENFGSNRKQAYDIAKILKKCDVFWIIGSARCKSVTYDDLKFYKDHNCISIRYGIESGSQKILDIMEKKFLAEDVYKAISNTVKSGIYTDADALMLGMPGENSETVKESARFITSLRYMLNDDWNLGKPFWAMAIPGTPLYEYCQQNNIIGKSLDEEHQYLLRTAEEKTTFLNYVNKTEEKIEDIYYWNYLFDFEGKLAFLDLIKKNSRSLRERISQIYNRCLKGELKHFKQNMYLIITNQTFYKKGNLLQKLKWIMLLMTSVFISLGAIILPKFMMYKILRLYSDIRFFLLKKKYYKNSGEQKYNIFSDRSSKEKSVLRVTPERIGSVDTQIERSLRNFTKINRKEFSIPISDEELSQQILNEGQ